MEARDTILSAAQQAALDKKKTELAIANERYLRDHPELREMLDKFTEHVLTTRPESVLAAAAAFFPEYAAGRTS